jgi:Aldehyde dehydrogenase family
MEEITTISPSSDKPILTRYGLSQDALDTLVVNAQAAFTSYKESHPTLISRQDIVAKALAALNVEQDALSKELTEQMGRPIAVSSTSPRILEKLLLRHISGGRLVEREPLPITLPGTFLLTLLLTMLPKSLTLLLILLLILLLTLPLTLSLTV